MRPLNIPIVLGSIRIGRKSRTVALFIHSRMAGDPRFISDFLDLGEHHFPMMEERLSEMAVPPPGLQEFSKKLEEADGPLIVSPEYKGGIPGVLKNAFDYLKPGILRRKPVGVCTVSAGGFGGLNCLTQLRLTILALGGLPIPDSLPVSRVEDFFDETGQPRDQKWPIQLNRFLDELLFYSGALAGTSGRKT